MTEEEFYKLHHKIIRDKRYKPQILIYEYRLKVEKVINRYLIQKEQIHHYINKDGSFSLVLCPNQQYHTLLHLREEALRYCGHANWKKCSYCKQYDDPKNLSTSKHRSYHIKCERAYYNRKIYNRKKSQNN